MKKRIQHGCTVYESMTDCMDALDLSYSVLTGLLYQAEQGPVMLLGQLIRPLSGAFTMWSARRPWWMLPG